MRLLRTFGLSRRGRAARLMLMGGLGDRRPSVLVSDMLTLTDGHQSCLLFEHAFLEQMPDAIRLLLVGGNFEDPL